MAAGRRLAAAAAPTVATRPPTGRPSASDAEPSVRARPGAGARLATGWPAEAGPGPVDATADGLTSEQEALLAAVRAEWTGVGFAAGAADRAAAEAGVRLAYRSAGLTPPARVVWSDSPLRGAVAAALIAGPDPLAGGGPLAAEVRDELSAQGLDLAAGDRGGRALHTTLRAELWADARSRVTPLTTPRLRALTWTLMSAPLGEQVRLVLAPVRNHVGREARDRLDAELAGRVREWSLHAVYGQHDASWLAVFAFLGRVSACPPAVGRLAGLMQVARAAGWWWPFERVAVVSERPAVLTRDELGRLHGGDGPAIAYPDGLGLHRWRGMPVPADLVERLDRLTVERIHAERNAELRRVMTELYGLDRYLRDAGATRVDADETGVLWRLPMRGDEELVMVEVSNSTPEPDGSSRRYWLRVPPGTRSARQAVAWTFGLEADGYRPLRQS
jgi:hypothetical protein